MLSATVAARTTLRLEGCRLIYEHDRNVVADRVLELARVADEAGFIGTILELTLAFWANENRQQLRGERHLAGS